MLDGEETVEIAWGCLGKASLGGSETACWTERKPCKYLAESFAGRERDSMLDDRKPCKYLAESFSGREQDSTSWTDRKPCK